MIRINTSSLKYWKILFETISHGLMENIVKCCLLMTHVQADRMRKVQQAQWLKDIRSCTVDGKLHTYVQTYLFVEEGLLCPDHLIQGTVSFVSLHGTRHVEGNALTASPDLHVLESVEQSVDKIILHNKLASY